MVLGKLLFIFKDRFFVFVSTPLLLLLRGPSMVSRPPAVVSADAVVVNVPSFHNLFNKLTLCSGFPMTEPNSAQNTSFDISTSTPRYIKVPQAIKVINMKQLVIISFKIFCFSSKVAIVCPNVLISHCLNVPLSEFRSETRQWKP